MTDSTDTDRLAEIRERCRNQHCMNCGDDRGGPIRHETHECQYDSAAAALRDALRPGVMLALSRLVQDAQQDTHPLADAAGSTGPYVVHGCVVYGAQQLRDAVRTVWKETPALLSLVEQLRTERDQLRDLFTVTAVKEGDAAAMAEQLKGQLDKAAAFVASEPDQVGRCESPSHTHWCHRHAHMEAREQVAKALGLGEEADDAM